MTVADLLEALVQPSLLSAPPVVPDAVGLDDRDRRRLRLASRGSRRRLRRAAWAERRRRALCAAGRCARRRPGRRRDAGAGGSPGRVGDGARRAPGAGAACRSLPRAPQRHAPRHRHHGNQREDDHRVPAPVDSRGVRPAVRRARHRRLQRRTRGPRSDPHDAGSARRAADVRARCWTTAARRR